MPKRAPIKLGNRHQVVELATDKVAPPTFTEEVAQIALAAVRLDGGTQNRALLSESVVEEYRELMQDADGWGAFPPVEVTYDGEHYWLTDGFHRIAAARGLNQPQMRVPSRVTPGTREDAVLRSLSANAEHGLRRTNADKRRAVERMLTDAEFGWHLFTDKVIAGHCAVSARYVGKVRDDLEHEGRIEAVTVRVGHDGRSMNVAAIGRQVAEPAPPRPLPVWEVAAGVEPAEEVLVLEEVRPAPAAPVQPQLLPKFEIGTLLLDRALLERLEQALTEGALRAYLTPTHSEALRSALRKALRA